MRERLGIAGFVVLLVAVWGFGFWWFGGHHGSSGEATAQKVKDTPSAQPTPSSTTSPSSTPSSTPVAAAKPFTGKVSAADEHRPVDLNPTQARPKPLSLPPVAEFTMATFNLLGSSHTRAGGASPGMASGPERLNGALQILASHGVSVVGFQEFQPDQRAAFQRRAQGWAMYPGLSMGRRAGENSVAWRTDTWDLVTSQTVPIPYFNGRIRPMPFVLLRNKQTGVQAYFSTFHNPADTGPFQHQQRFRTAATGREIELFNRLEQTGIPQFVTGDMNERAEYFCRVTRATVLRAAAGGSTGGGCAPPTPTQIDWIFGSPGVQFTDYVNDRSPLVRHTTDHPVVVTKVVLDALKFPKAYDPSAG